MASNFSSAQPTTQEDTELVTAEHDESVALSQKLGASGTGDKDVDTPIQPADQERCEVAVTQPKGTSSIESIPDRDAGGEMNILNPVQNVHRKGIDDVVSSGDGIELPLGSDVDDMVQTTEEKGKMENVDAKNFRVMQGRDKGEPNRKKVESIKRAVIAGRNVTYVRVYRDKTTRELFSPNGAHRQQAFDELGLPVPVILFEVENARERAEWESCFANEDNGLGRSPADMQFQTEKAFTRLTEKLNRPPKPKELAEATQTDVQYASRFLRKRFAKEAGDDNDEELKTNIPSSLQKILDELRKIAPSVTWTPGCLSEPILIEIGKEVRRIANHKPPSPGVKPEEIKVFMEEHKLSNKQMAKMVESTPQTIGRWLAGSVKISESNARILRQIMSYTCEQIRALLDDEVAGDE